MKLYYAEKEFKGDIQEKEFETFKGLRNEIEHILAKDDCETVYLLAYEVEDSLGNKLESQDNLILVSHKRNDIFGYLIDDHFFKPMKNLQAMWLYELTSYEDAYKIARDMKEINPLCYNQNQAG